MRKTFRRLAAILMALLLVVSIPVSAAAFEGSNAPGGSSGEQNPGGDNAPGGNSRSEEESGTAPGSDESGSGGGESSENDESGISTASTYTTITAPGSFTSSDSSDNTLSVIAYYNSAATVSDLTISDSTSGVNGVVVSSADVDFDNISITLDTDADGSDTCDFTGKGTAFAVYGSSNVTLSNSTISTTGVATMPLFTDKGATLTVKSSTVEALGGTLYSSYTNTYNQSTMVAPPWVLGIMGTSRASNLMGTNSTLNFLDSTAKAALWAVLSTDSGSGMVMNVYNSTLELTQTVETSKTIQEDGGQITTYDNPYTTNYGSGYGTYVIGSAEENMVGVTMNVGTYAAIFTGGSMSFSTLTAGDYTLTNADNSTTSYSYSGADRNSVINSDTFGFMAHQNDNTLTLGSGTALNSGYTGFLIKTGGSLSSFTANITDADISVGNNVLIQLLDNEDDLIGTSGSGFNTTYTESSGWNTSSSSSKSSASVTFNFSDMDDLEGNIYNASGYQLSGTGATVNLDNTTYKGAAASTTAMHVTYEGSEYVKDTLNGYALDADATDDTLTDYQNTSISISEYYNLGHVANKINSNGYNSVTMSLTDGSTWYVTGTSVVSSLSVDSSSSVVLVGDATLTVGSTTYSSSNLSSTYNMTHVDLLEDEDTECEHSYTSEVTTEATCTTDGVMTYTCSKCGDTYTETIAATGHSYDEGVVTTAATCTEDGVMTYTCTVCGDTYTEAIAATGHTYVNGVCTVCGASESDVTEPMIKSYEASGTKSVTVYGAWPTSYTVDGKTYEISSYGFVYIRTSRLGGSELTALTVGRVKVILSTSTSYTIVGTRSDTKYTVRAYISYTDDDGNMVYVYSDAIEVSHDTAPSAE
ncbi:MAG: hypothetical protein LUH03_08420 [Oscillospiraceae bacterium]|nr:hypothetical protein [Oscillospiraceae bacterium]